ncbi:MAG TPA: hypothetical protein VM939_12610 [Gemmatimonadaceae bacterium]|nr:hypothetical protein [Gemmatimonadaceae bacterium]
MRPLILALLISSLAGCVNPFDPGREITLEVSDVAAPASVSPSGPLSITLTVVSGGCRRFDGIKATRASNKLTLEARGIDSSGPTTSCTTDIRFEPKTYEAQGPFTDPFVITVVQPNGNLVTRTIRVQ